MRGLCRAMAYLCEHNPNGIRQFCLSVRDNVGSGWDQATACCGASLAAKSALTSGRI